MRTIDWFMADYFAMEGELCVHFQSLRTHLPLRRMWWKRQILLHFIKCPNRGPPLNRTNNQ